MHDEPNPSSSATEQQPEATPWLPTPWRQLFAVLALAIPSFYVVELLFQPLRSRHFLRSDENAAAYEPYGYVFGVILAVCFGWVLWASRDAAPNQERFGGRSGRSRFVLMLLIFPVLGGFVGWDTATAGLPAAQHHFAAKTDVGVPFTITGVSSGRYCHGVRAFNPKFIDDKLCGVERDGHSREWEGRTIVVTGGQSRYGLTIERYRFEERGPQLQRSELQEIFRSCVRLPQGAPASFRADLKVVVGATGEIRSMDVVSSRLSPEHEDAARSIVASFKTCSHFRNVPAGTYALPVAVR